MWPKARHTGSTGYILLFKTFTFNMEGIVAYLSQPMVNTANLCPPPQD